MGYPTKLSEDRLDEDVIDHSEEIRKWRTAFLWSLVTGLPVMIIMLYFLIDSRLNPCDEGHNMTSSSGGGATDLVEMHGCMIMIVPGLSLETLLLFILCTLCLVCGSHIFLLFCFITACCVFIPDSWRSLLLHSSLESPQTQDGEHGCTHRDGDVRGVHVLGGCRPHCDRGQG